jgi:hypothetical protein
MSTLNLPSLTLANWKDTRDTLHKYCKMAGAIKESLSVPHPHWWHISLRITDKGLSTTPIPKDKNTPGQNFELIFDFMNHHIIIESNFREIKRIKLTGQSLSALCEETCSLLKEIGVKTSINKEVFRDGKSGRYDQEAVSNYWIALKEVSSILNSFRSELTGMKSPVQLWPHHFDLAMSWFSGRLIPGKDPNDPESSEEQMMFGFSTGDEIINDAYFYISAYPVPDTFPNFDMPADVKWSDDGFTGGVMMYDDFAKSDNPQEKLLNYFRTFQSAGAKLMS